MLPSRAHARAPHPSHAHACGELGHRRDRTRARRDAATGRDPGARIALTECRLPKVAQAGAVRHASKCPRIAPTAGGRKLSIFVAVLPANTLSPKPDPLVMLAGGPGQAASTLGPFALQLAAVRRTRDIVLDRPARHGPLVAARLRGVRARRARRARHRSVPKSLLRASSQLAAPRRRRVRNTRRPRAIADLDAVREALGYERIEPVGRQLRHARRAGVPAPVSRSACAASCSTASRRRRCASRFDVWRTRDDALDGVIAACRASAPCCESASRSRRDAARRSSRARRRPRRSTCAIPRTGEHARRARRRSTWCIGALQPLHVRAGERRA